MKTFEEILLVECDKSGCAGHERFTPKDLILEEAAQIYAQQFIKDNTEPKPLRSLTALTEEEVVKYFPLMKRVTSNDWLSEWRIFHEAISCYGTKDTYKQLEEAGFDVAFTLDNQ